MGTIAVTPDNYDQIIAESCTRLVVLGFVNDERLLSTLAEEDEGAWLFGHVADTEANRIVAERQEVSVRPTLVALLEGRMTAHTRADNVTETRLREWMDVMLRVSISDIKVSARGEVAMPRVPES
ncbi:hypothetical protein LWC34_09675 [Kibdelosporangium philippinense]|uniref:Uncharacterized protein n=1 Tax=Kibdelosporangium philippinense TaxID=211113 RepID=A0ABS8Z5I9_9PSEU|nr:hypothetical protein [Kibdelosporangium philippinense]MCE7003095.1 hypothetical protein [Kibdelosporangium philippinense]